MTARSLSLFALALVAACSSNPAVSTPDAAAAPDAAATPDAIATDATAADATAGGGFTATPYVTAAPERVFSEAEMVLAPGRDYRAVIETDAGRITVDLYETQTPLTVNSFVFLALHHFFDGLAFHRVLDGFVAQGGDPNTAADNRRAWGTGGPGYQFDTESVGGLTFDGAGVLGMARAASRTTNGSQFFITLAATPTLNGQYTVFGRVTDGLDVLARIARNENAMTPPTTPTRMTRVTIEERAR
jgi:cyclophilin family peptidyl-prolyl cis-trans isomerase